MLATLTVISPLLAIENDDHGHAFVTIPIGSSIEMSGDLNGPGLVNIRLGERNLLAFARDLEERAQIADTE